MRLLKQTWNRISKEDKAGLYVTVIIHLTVIIVLLATGIHTELRSESSFLLDFSAAEEEQRKIEEEIFKETISKKLDELLSMQSMAPSYPSGKEIRNIAVDGSTALKDDRGTDAEQLYRDAEELAKKLERKAAIEEDAREEAVDLDKETVRETAKAKEYSGPSVLSYTLDGRKASHLKIPAYRCYTGGQVTVIITVDNSGRVINAKVLDEVSTADKCLRDFAVRAARLSVFSKSQTAPPRQTGEIVYLFIAQ